MAGHEAMLAQWFHRPLRRADIELAGRWFSSRSATRAFPHELWHGILDSQPGDDIYLPIDIWGFPGGQTFLAGMPCLFFEGSGGAISYLEPAMCRYFAPIIQATKGRLMKLATPRDAEFGLRSAPNELSNLVLLLARYVGGRGQLTSNDTAEFLYPELFRIDRHHRPRDDVRGPVVRPVAGRGRVRDDGPLRHGDGARRRCCATWWTPRRSVWRTPCASSRPIRKPSASASASIPATSPSSACSTSSRCRQAGITPRTIVFEDEVTPDMVRKVYDHFRRETGQEPTMLFPGAGGYWWRLVHRDTLAAAFKRSATGEHPNVKFSNSPGKESLGGYLRVYGRDDTLVVADASETIEGEPLFVKLVEQGRIVYRESFDEQADRADRTWGRYRRIVLSAKIHEWRERFRTMREREVTAARRDWRRERG